MVWVLQVQPTIEVERQYQNSQRYRRWFRETGMLSGGENNVVGDTLTFDGDIFGGGADLTCQVATTIKQTRGIILCTQVILTNVYL